MELKIRRGIAFCFAVAVLTLCGWSYWFQSSEYEIVSIDPGSWLVTARGNGGDTLSFRMHPSVFQGRCFHANLTGVREGGRFSVVGPPGERFDRLEAESAPGNRPGQGVARGPRPSRRPSTRGMQNYCITAVDASEQTATAESKSGETIRFRIDVSSFRGYRFRVPTPAELVAGGRFSLAAPNEAPVRCCTLIERLR